VKQDKHFVHSEYPSPSHESRDNRGFDNFPYSLFWAEPTPLRPVLIENRHLCSGFSEQGCSRKSPPGTGAVQTVVDLLSYRMFVLMRTFMAFWILWPQKQKIIVDVSKRSTRVGSS
jgi:hypothetical protein